MAIKDLKNLTPEEWENLTQEDWRDIWMGIVQSSRDSIPEFERVELTEDQKAKVQQLLKELKIDTSGKTGEDRGKDRGKTGGRFFCLKK